MCLQRPELIQLALNMPLRMPLDMQAATLAAMSTLGGRFGKHQHIVVQVWTAWCRCGQRGAVKFAKLHVGMNM